MVRSARAYAGLIALLVLAGCAEPAPSQRLTSGAEHACALEIGATPRCWGQGEQGQLAGGGTRFGLALDIGAGGYSTCAVDLEGVVRCVGENNHGQLGDGTLERRSEPVTVMGLPPMEAVSVGFAHACARGAEGDVWCWGWSSLGQAVPSTSGDAPPTRVEGLPPIVQLVAGYTHTCAIDEAAEAYCWGELTDGEARRLEGDVRAIAIGVDHVCFLRSSEVRCIGNEPGGSRPALPDGGARFALAAGAAAAGAIDHACFATDDGAACLGKNMSGQLGDGRIGDVALAPVAVAELGGPATQLAVGDRHSCAIVDERVLCWGWNDVGQLGDDSGIHSLVPQPLP